MNAPKINKIPNSVYESNNLWIGQYDFPLSSNTKEYKEDSCFFVPPGDAELGATSGAFNRKG